jgi:hypothetical protein
MESPALDSIPPTNPNRPHCSKSPDLSATKHTCSHMRLCAVLGGESYIGDSNALFDPLIAPAVLPRLEQKRCSKHSSSTRQSPASKLLPVSLLHDAIFGTLQPPTQERPSACALHFDTFCILLGARAGTTLERIGHNAIAQLCLGHIEL